MKSIFKNEWWQLFGFVLFAGGFIATIIIVLFFKKNNFVLLSLGSFVLGSVISLNTAGDYLLSKMKK